MRPAYRIETPRLVLRCWEPRDADLLGEAIVASLAHLRPWMPWVAGEPLPAEERVAKLRRWRAAFDRDEEFVYGIFDSREHAVLGGCGLHPRSGPGAIEIGYWIHVDHTRQGYATEVAGALTIAAVVCHGVDRVEIHHDPTNVPSGRVPEKLGYRHDATLRRRARRPRGDWRGTDVWSMMSDELDGTPAGELAVSLFDCRGAKIAARAPAPE